MHSPVRAQLVIDSAKNAGVSEEDREKYFADLAGFVRDLDLYQRREGAHKWSIVDKHAVFCVEKITLRLRRMHITPSVMKSAEMLMALGIPVDLSRLNLDFRYVSCTEEELHSFVQTTTAGATELIVDTGSLFQETEEEESAADAGNQDCRDRIRMMMKAIGSITNMHGLNMAGVLRLCTTVQNREAVWRGLFEDVLSQDEPLELLTFNSEVDLTERDGVSIVECAMRWHHANPNNTLSVKHLELFLVEHADIDGVHGILLAFDDLEKLTLSFEEPRDLFSRRDVVNCLRYPSLRSLKLMNLPIPTMDLFDPSISDPQIARKPVLQELHLESIRLEDIASMPRFLHQLKQTSAATNELANSLRVFRVAQDNHDYDQVPIFDRKAVAQLDDVLVMNRSLALLSISIDYNDREHSVASMGELLAKHSDRAVPTMDDPQQSALVKARNLAFLSTISPRITRDRDVGTRARLYSSLASQIFEFTAPHKRRKMGFSFVNM